MYLQVLPAWPELVDWKLLDLQLAVDASNFKRRTELTRAGLDASGENGEDDHCLHADRAAVLAVTAWEMAKRTRRENDLDPLDVTHTWEIVEPAQAHIEKRAKIEALRRGEIQSLADPLPVDSDAPNEP
ncbi:MAG TPA: hypothetical protein DEH03_09900 [Brevundimonas sp.]|nr:hypothetical protein [Brevundimonas sp.]